MLSKEKDKEKNQLKQIDQRTFIKFHKYLQCMKFKIPMKKYICNLFKKIKDIFHSSQNILNIPINFFTENDFEK